MRGRYGLTQEEASQLTGLSHKHYQAIESGRKKQIWLETVERLAKAYGLTVAEILQDRLPENLVVLERPPASSAHYRKRTVSERKPVSARVTKKVAE